MADQPGSLARTGADRLDPLLRRYIPGALRCRPVSDRAYGSGGQVGLGTGNVAGSSVYCAPGTGTAKGTGNANTNSNGHATNNTDNNGKFNTAYNTNTNQYGNTYTYKY